MYTSGFQIATNVASNKILLHTSDLESPPNLLTGTNLYVNCSFNLLGDAKNFFYHPVWKKLYKFFSFDEKVMMS